MIQDALMPPEPLRAQIARSNVALSLATTQGDMPLVMVNRGFQRLTGFDQAAVIGRNCRLLQDDTIPLHQIAAMSAFLRDDTRDDGRFPVLNRRIDGTGFVNLVFLSKLRDHEGQIRFVIASQFDITSARQAAALAGNDEALIGMLDTMRQTVGQFGLTMTDSAGLIARSITTLARFAVRDE